MVWCLMACLTCILAVPFLILAVIHLISLFGILALQCLQSKNLGFMHNDKISVEKLLADCYLEP